jgi:hypothetical protein
VGRFDNAAARTMPPSLPIPGRRTAMTDRMDGMMGVGWTIGLVALVVPVLAAAAPIKYLRK